MFRRDFMPRSHNAALEQGESRFHGIRVNVAVGVVLGMVNRSVEVLLHLVQRPRIDSRFVSNNHFHMAAEIRIDNLSDGRGCCVFGVNHAEIAVALPDADDNLLIGTVTPLARLAANIGFINLNRAAKFLRGNFEHRVANPVAEIPRGFIADGKLASHLVGRHAFARLTEQVRCEKPLPERQMGIVEDSLGRYAELVRARIADKLVALEDAIDLVRAALQALNPIWPAEAF